MVLPERSLSPVEVEALDDLLGRGLYFDRKGRPISAFQMHLLRASRPDYYRVGQDQLLGGLGPVEVSTVWMGLNHAFRSDRLEIFETMLFSDGELDGSTWRYATLRQAEIGHRRVVRCIRQLQHQPVPLVKPRKTRNRHWR